MVIGGSSTRNEKNWTSTVFSNDTNGFSAKKKLLGKEDNGKGALYGDENHQYERKTMSSGFHKNASMTTLEMIPKDYTATRRS